MNALVPLFLTLSASVFGFSLSNCTRYAFFRDLDNVDGRTSNTSKMVSGRRVFGGAAVSLETFPSACALLDRYLGGTCSAAVVRDHWVITAAHCVSARVSYVRYNARRLDYNSGDLAPILHRYRHPHYNVVEKDEGFGMDITELQNDVGLVRTRRAMTLTSKSLRLAPPGSHLDPLLTMEMYHPQDLTDKEIDVYGFGRTERTAHGEELFTVQLTLQACVRAGWYPCLCGAARSGGNPRGVCTGDSGGPVVYRNAQVGVTSMGPLECAEYQAPGLGATSVFTSLYQYRDIINATIEDTQDAVRMVIVRDTATGLRPHLIGLAALVGTSTVILYR